MSKDCYGATPESLYSDKNDVDLVTYARHIITAMERNGYHGMVWTEVVNRFEKCIRSESGTIDRNAVIEECAVAAEAQARWIGYNVHAEAIAKAIRELKNAAPQPVAQLVRASGKSAEAEDTEGRGFESRQTAGAASTNESQDKQERHDPREIVMLLNDPASVGRALPLCKAAECIEQLEQDVLNALRQRNDESRIRQHVERELAALRSASSRIDEGKVWSFLRSVLSQGASIQQDYVAGNHKSYEEYAARMDAAARERTDTFPALLSDCSAIGQQGGDRG